jgi:hypothetical protein
LTKRGIPSNDRDKKETHSIGNEKRNVRLIDKDKIEIQDRFNRSTKRGIPSIDKDKTNDLLIDKENDDQSAEREIKRERVTTIEVLDSTSHTTLEVR